MHSRQTEIGRDIEFTYETLRSDSSKRWRFASESYIIKYQRQIGRRNISFDLPISSTVKFNSIRRTERFGNRAQRATVPWVVKVIRCGEKSQKVSGHNPAE